MTRLSPDLPGDPRFGVTRGIARRLDVSGLDGDTTVEAESGGGDQNGSAQTAHLSGQAGTGMGRVALPRKPPNPNNYCGII